MVGYKLFTPSWEAVLGKGGKENPYQYELGKVYEEPDTPMVARTGFHFCKKLIDCFNYYEIDSRNRIGLIEAMGDVAVSGHACATNKMRILKEIHWADVVTLIEEQMDEQKGV